MKDYTKMLHVKNQNKEIILLDPNRELNNSSNLVTAIENLFTLLETEEYLEFPISTEPIKYMKISKKTKFFNLYQKLSNIEVKNIFQDKLFYMIPYIICRNNEYLKEAFTKLTKLIVKTQKEENKSNFSHAYKKLIKKIAMSISFKINENDTIKNINIFRNYPFKENNEKFNIEELRIFGVFLINFKKVINYTYFDDDIGFQTILNYFIFNDYKNPDTQKILEELLSKMSREYNVGGIPIHYIKNMTNDNLLHFVNKLKELKKEVGCFLQLELLNRKILSYEELTSLLGKTKSLREMVMYITSNKHDIIDPLYYKDVLFELAYKNPNSTFFIGTENAEEDFKEGIRWLNYISKDFLREYTEMYSDEIKNIYKKYDLSLEMINLNNYFKINAPAYGNILFYNDVQLMQQNTRIKSRKWNFILMMNALFRMDTETRKLVSSSTMKEIINNGVKSFIGSTDTYSLRNRMARIMASFIHEKNNENIDEKYLPPKKEDIRYLIETFSNSKLRSSFFAKIFNMPQKLEANYYEINENMENSIFFKRTYSEFVNMISDIDYSTELDSVILLLSLS
jgi:hypothetical protein